MIGLMYSPPYPPPRSVEDTSRLTKSAARFHFFEFCNCPLAGHSRLLHKTSFDTSRKIRLLLRKTKC
jgi:hypothetical protein